MSTAISTTSTTSEPAAPRAVRWRSVAIFMGVAYGLMALCAAPFWVLPGGIHHVLYGPVIALAMFAPTIASVVVTKLVDRVPWRATVGLRFRGRWGRLALWSVLAVAIMLAITLLSGVVMVLRGVPGDLTGSWFARTAAEQMGAKGLRVTPVAAAAIVLATTAINLLVTVVPALGEEIGWRGWLRRELAPLGPARSLALGGAIWSLWHLPITLIGHNYPGRPRVAAIAMFLVVCIALNLLFDGIVARAGGNPIASAFAHATLNTTMPLSVGLFSDDRTASAVDLFVDTPFGIVGVVLIVIAALLVRPRRSAHHG